MRKGRIVFPSTVLIDVALAIQPWFETGRGTRFHGSSPSSSHATPLLPVTHRSSTNDMARTALRVKMPFHRNGIRLRVATAPAFQTRTTCIVDCRRW